MLRTLPGSWRRSFWKPGFSQRNGRLNVLRCIAGQRPFLPRRSPESRQIYPKVMPCDGWRRVWALPIGGGELPSYRAQFSPAGGSEAGSNAAQTLGGIS
jgi:hypothetical protein